MTQAGTIAGVARAAVCGAVAHFGVVVTTGTAAHAGIALIARRAAFPSPCVGYGIAGNAVVNIKHFVDGSISRGRYPGSVASLTAVAVAAGSARAHALRAHAVKRLTARGGIRAAGSGLQVKWLSWEGGAIF